MRTRSTPKPRSQCKECEAAYERERQQRPEIKKRRQRVKREWEENNPKKVQRMHLRRRIRVLGFSEDQIEDIADLYEQTDCCEICGNNGSTLHIDHDHETGQLRGFICHHCNLALGHFQDDLERLRAAMAYLNRPKQIGP